MPQLFVIERNSAHRSTDFVTIFRGKPLLQAEHEHRHPPAPPR
jgi:hypothetical protein